MRINLEPVQINQISKILSLIKQYYEYDGLKYVPSTARKAITELLNHKELGEVWWVELDGETVGYVILAYCFCVELKGKIAIVDELYLIDAARGQGLGLKILSNLKKFCRKQKIKFMRLEVEYSNQRAKNVYEKFGFRAHERFLMSHGI